MYPDVGAYAYCNVERDCPQVDGDVHAGDLTTSYDQLQKVIDQTAKDILVVQGDWNAKVGKNAYENWQGIYEPFCNDDKNERGLRLLEFATFSDLLLPSTFGHHKASRRWTWHSPDGQHHN